MLNPLKPPSSLYSRIRNEAPLITIGENYGRRGDFYGEEDEESRGFRSVLIYIQKGLGTYSELIGETVKFAVKIQYQIGIYYQLIPLSFGWTDKLLFEKYFEMYSNDISICPDKIVNKLIQLAGIEKGNESSAITELFPKADIRSLYQGKTKVSTDDLLIFIGSKNEIRFSSKLKLPLQKLKKNILLVEADDKNILWSYKPGNLIIDNK